MGHIECGIGWLMVVVTLHDMVSMGGTVLSATYAHTMD